MLADRSGMNERGRFLYYASHPEIESTQKFNQECSSKEEGTAVLGCYTGSKIYIYGVTDARLDGIRDVTAAHEMLHAAYQRLSRADRDKVDGLVETEYAKLQNDDEFKDRMAFYARTEPGQRDNELHSVIGTEVGSVSAELEQYYGKYFSDRSKVVALHTAYSSVFDNLEAEAKNILSQLGTLGEKIQTDSKKYNEDVVKLNKDIQAFNARAESGDFTSQAQFNSERLRLTNRVSALAGQRESINTELAQYEELRAQYNKTASETKKLNDSLNSKLAPAPSI